MTRTATATRTGGRSARRAMRTAPNFEMLPGLTRGIPLCEVMDGAQVERIDAASMDILENVGVSSSVTPSRWKTGRRLVPRSKANSSIWIAVWCVS